MLLRQNKYVFPSLFFIADMVCEHKPMNMACEAGQVISIQSAMYGRRKAKVCPGANDGKTNCEAKNSLKVVQGLCDGKEKCQVKASNGVFGDPCRGTFKYLQVSYSCEEPGKKTSRP